MNEVLLDTHTFLWALSGSPELSATALNILADLGVSKNLSLVSVWELSIKSGLGKLHLPMSLAQCLKLARGTGLRLAPIELEEVLRVETLPLHHRDPFDRLLACQCLEKSLPLLSRDGVFDAYGVDRLW